MEADEVKNRSDFILYCKSVDIRILPRDKNSRFRWVSGSTFETLENFIKTDLKESNCIAGPEPDDDPREKGDIYKFKTTYNGIPVYIKGKAVKTLDNENIVKILSFHKDGD